MDRMSMSKFYNPRIHSEPRGRYSKEAEIRIIEGCNIWRALTGLLCNKKIPTKLKILIYKIARRPALLYVNETWPVIGFMENKIGRREMRMLRYCLEIILQEHQNQ